VKTEYIIKLVGGLAIFLVPLLVAMWRSKRTSRPLKDLGARWTTSLGICLTGLPLDEPARVSCGGNATEILFIKDEDLREVVRIPWSAIQQIFGGDEPEIQSLLSVGDGLPSLTLGQWTPELNKHKYKLSYLVIDWKDRNAGSKQAVFQVGGKRSGSFIAQYLNFMKDSAHIPRAVA
jgi:hypothetical protein